MTAGTPLSDRSIGTPEDLDSLAFWENGLLPVVAQDIGTGDVLMVAFANREALERTLQSGEMHYWSRSRQELWHKGATSGNVQALVSLHADCDQDTLLALVRPSGPACHTNERTCFGDLDPVQEASELEPDQLPEPAMYESVLPTLWGVLAERARTMPEGSYTTRLLADENLRLKKLGEETAELLFALARDRRAEIPREAADLVYHLLVALLGAEVTLEDLLNELDARRE